jgi:hypothetical protein
MFIDWTVPHYKFGQQIVYLIHFLWDKNDVVEYQKTDRSSNRTTKISFKLDLI